MLIGICAALLGIVFHVAGSCRPVGDDRGRPLWLTVWTRDPVSPSQVARLLHTAGWLASIVGALAIPGALWNSRPGLSIAIAVTVLVLVNGLPTLLVTVVHDRRLRS
ncbi:hypothetical protein [Rhodococcus sp. ACT016]|uniref:hypothetical protein n=1 Tax=Rhodococcus sp. ACT016 TaxID=3134808 RepID=UPI003D2B537A